MPHPAFQTLSPWSNTGKVDIPLKNYDFSISLNLPRTNEKQYRNDVTEQSFESVLQTHTEFKTLMYPDSIGSEKFSKRCKAEVETINLFFPGTLNENTRIVFAAWLAFACGIDDIVEALPTDEGEAALRDCIEILYGNLEKWEEGTYNLFFTSSLFHRLTF